MCGASLCPGPRDLTSFFRASEQKSLGPDLALRETHDRDGGQKMRIHLPVFFPELTAESGVDVGAVAHELHSNLVVAAAATLALARVGSQAGWLPHPSSKTFPITSLWR